MLAAFCAAEPAKEGRASFELRRVPKPSTEDLPAGTILIKSYAVSICGSDLWGKGGCCDSPEWRRPTDYLRQQMYTCGGTGHEALGEVAEVVEPCRFRVGQRVLALSAAYVQAVGSIGPPLRAKRVRALIYCQEQEHSVSSLCLTPACALPYPHIRLRLVPPLILGGTWLPNHLAL